MINMNHIFTVGVAQLAEHRVVAPAAAGSNPVTHPINETSGGSAPFLFECAPKTVKFSTLRFVPFYHTPLNFQSKITAIHLCSYNVIHYKNKKPGEARKMHHPG
jgi:hypothetical protein